MAYIQSVGEGERPSGVQETGQAGCALKQYSGVLFVTTHLRALALASVNRQ